MPFAVVKPPIPLESLEGLLERHRRFNHYNESGWAYDLLACRRDHPLNMLRAQEDYDRLAQAFGPDAAHPERAFAEPDATEWKPTAADLVNLTSHRFVRHILLPHEVALLRRRDGDWSGLLWEPDTGKVYINSERRKGHRKVCPRCWNEHQTLFIPWSVRLVTTCPAHNTLLVDRCICGKRLRFDLGTGRCLACHESVGNVPTLDLASHLSSQEVTCLVWSAIGCSDESFPPQRLALPAANPVSSAHGAAILRFMMACANLIARRDPESPLFSPAHMPPGMRWRGPAETLHFADVSTVHGTLLAMWELLKGWPKTWDDELTRIAAIEERENRTVSHFAATLFETLDNPAFGWLYRAWGDFVYRNLGRTPGVFRWFRYYQSVRRRLDGELKQLVGQDDARQVLGMGADTLKRSLDSGRILIRDGYEERQLRAWRVLDEEALASLRQRRASQLTLEQAVAYLGVGKSAVRALLATGMLDNEEPRQGRSGAPLLLTREGIERFLATYLAALPVRPPGIDSKGHWLDLHDALASVRSSGMGLPELLEATRAGTVAACRTAEELSLLKVMFESSCIAAYRSSRNPVLGPEEYTSYEVCQLLRCTQTSLRHWREAGLLLPSTILDDADGEHWRYAGSSIADFVEKYAGSEEAATLLDCSPQTVCKWVRHGRLVPAVVHRSGKREVYLFDRAALREIMESQVTTDQAAALLGIDVRMFNMWVSQGFLVPVAAIGTKRRWYGRQQVLAARERIVLNPRTGRPCAAQAHG